MAKANQSIEVKQQPGALATQWDGPAPTFEVEGADGMSLSLMGRLAVWNSTPVQMDAYGEIEGVRNGDLIDTMGKRKCASNMIVPVHGFTIFQRWDRDAKAPAYTYPLEQKHRVPREDLEPDANGNTAAYKAFCLICLVPGEAYPFLMTFKRTSLRTGEDIMRWVARRSSMGQSPGAYQIGVKSDKSAAGQSYLRTVLVGNPHELDADTAALYKVVFAGIEQVKARAERVASEAEHNEPGAHDDGIPI
jgi:hypothetical protein